jgi:hypothetical protein
MPLCCKRLWVSSYPESALYTFNPFQVALLVHVDREFKCYGMYRTVYHSILVSDPEMAVATGFNQLWLGIGNHPRFLLL